MNRFSRCVISIWKKASQLLKHRTVFQTQEYVPVSLATAMFKPQPSCPLWPNVCAVVLPSFSDLTLSDVMDMTRFSHLENIMDNTQIHKKRMNSNPLESLIAENVLMNSWLKLGMRPTTLTHAGLRSWEHGFERPKHAIYLLFSPQLSVQTHLFK